MHDISGSEFSHFIIEILNALKMHKTWFRLSEHNLGNLFMQENSFHSPYLWHDALIYNNGHEQGGLNVYSLMLLQYIFIFFFILCRFHSLNSAYFIRYHRGKKSIDLFRSKGNSFKGAAYLHNHSLIHLSASWILAMPCDLHFDVAHDFVRTELYRFHSFVGMNALHECLQRIPKIISLSVCIKTIGSKSCSQ